MVDKEKVAVTYSKNSGIVKYYKRLFNLKNEKKLIISLNQEYQNAYSYFKTEKFDYVLILNGSFNVENRCLQRIRYKMLLLRTWLLPQ